MKKLTIQDLSSLPESDRGLLFNYFSAMSAARHRQKLVFGSAALGALFMTTVYFTDDIILYNTPEWFEYVIWFVNLIVAISILIAVIGNLVAARSFRKNAVNYEKKLTARGLDASGLTFDDVFEHVAISMFRQQGLKIKE